MSTVTTTTTTTAHQHLTRAARAQHAEVAQVLGAAFLDDPVFGWIVPDRADLEATIVPVFDAFVGVFARHDESWAITDGDRPVGAALWAPPGVEAVHPDDEAALADRLVEGSGPYAGRLATCMELFAAVHPTEPAWYLAFLGVVPAAQGQGTGSRLLRAVLERADAAGEAAYLEATSVRNRDLYERHGFRVTREVTLPDGPTAFAMWRDPA